MLRTLSAALLLAPLACAPSAGPAATAGGGYADAARPATSPEAEPGFADQWYAGVAELNAYDLEQVRYGEVRRGSAVLIFVTEDLDRGTQVKLDAPPARPEDAVKVLKLNAARDFETGIYAYHTLQSVFTPVRLHEDPATLKVSTSSQEWCGHVYQQLNREENGFRSTLHSYFQGEADAVDAVPDVLLEDEVLNRIRLAPETLPTGSFEALPSTLDLRLLHEPVRPVPAEARFEPGERVSRYVLTYPGRGVEWRVEYTTAFPREILGWEKELRQGGRTLTTRARRRAVERLPYWRLNGVSDSTYRRALGL